jgi:hypothetical protein
LNLTGQIRGNPTLFRDTLAAISSDPRTEAIVVQFTASGTKDLLENAEHFKNAAAKDIPMVISFVAEVVPQEVKKEFTDAGILLSEDPT